MKEIEAPKMPESYEAFAKAIAAIADSHGIDMFLMRFRPSWNGPDEGFRNVYGDMEIHYKTTDGRGGHVRICRFI